MKRRCVLTPLIMTYKSRRAPAYSKAHHLKHDTSRQGALEHRRPELEGEPQGQVDANDVDVQGCAGLQGRRQAHSSVVIYTDKQLQIGRDADAVIVPNSKTNNVVITSRNSTGSISNNISSSSGSCNNSCSNSSNSSKCAYGIITRY